MLCALFNLSSISKKELKELDIAISTWTVHINPARVKDGGYLPSPEINNMIGTVVFKD
jgi:hypothetical protein